MYLEQKIQNTGKSGSSTTDKLGRSGGISRRKVGEVGEIGCRIRGGEKYIFSQIKHKIFLLIQNISIPYWCGWTQC